MVTFLLLVGAPYLVFNLAAINIANQYVSLSSSLEFMNFLPVSSGLGWVGLGFPFFQFFLTFCPSDAMFFTESGDIKFDPI